MMSRVDLRIAFVCLLLLALALRLAALLAVSMHHPDEVLQYLEPAHRLLFGYGIETWEYRYGMRGWLLPALLSGPMALGAVLSSDSGFITFLPRLAAMLATLAIPLAAWQLGRLVSPRHGVIAMAAVAVWFETVFFSSHILSEVLGVAAFLPAAALIMNPAQEHRWRRDLLAGLLLGLAVAMRFHYGPAIAVFVMLECGLAFRRRWLPVALGGLGGLAIAGLADIATGHAPLVWMWVNLTQNIVHDRAADYGVEPVWYYVLLIGGFWLWALPFIAAAILPALARFRSLIVAAAVNFALLSLIGHKEYRFMLLTTTVAVLVAAIGSLDLVDRWRRGRWSEGRRLWFAAGLWAALSASLAIGPYMHHRWTAEGPALLAAQEAGRWQPLCGLGLHRLKFWGGGGYSWLHRDVPVYLTRWSDATLLDAPGIARSSRGYNAVIAAEGDLPDLPAAFRPVSCRGAGENRVCLLTRAGPCDPAAAADWEVQGVMKRHDN